MALEGGQKRQLGRCQRQSNVRRVAGADVEGACQVRGSRARKLQAGAGVGGREHMYSEGRIGSLEW
jgi:hypothetical protein